MGRIGKGLGGFKQVGLEPVEILIRQSFRADFHAVGSRSGIPG